MKWFNLEAAIWATTAVGVLVIIYFGWMMMIANMPPIKVQLM